MKLTHAQAGYTTGDPHYCRGCKYYHGDRDAKTLRDVVDGSPSCELVQSPIHPDGWCKLWTAKSK
jgi:hypothetical protein